MNRSWPRTPIASASAAPAADDASPYCTRPDGGSKQRRRNGEQRGFPGAVRAKQRHDLPGVASQVDLVEDAASAEVARDVGEGDRAGNPSGALCGRLVVQLRVDAFERCQQLPAAGSRSVPDRWCGHDAVLRARQLGEQAIAACVEPLAPPCRPASPRPCACFPRRRRQGWLVRARARGCAATRADAEVR